MNIPIPRWLVRAWDQFCDWANVTIWGWGRWNVCRLDMLVALGFVFCVSYYGYFYGWRGALQGGAMYAFVTYVSVLFRPDRRES